ncbi:MAG: mechanosensitive ion channel domain-containing protein, partial [Acidobacteriota bacterium]
MMHRPVTPNSFRPQSPLPRSPSRALALWVCFAIWQAAAGAYAQTTPESAPPAAETSAAAEASSDSPAQDAAAAQEDSEVEEVPPGLSSPRAAMATFLEAFDPQKAPEGWHPLDRAAFTLDLSEVDPGVRRQQGREIAAQLKEVLDRSLLIEVAELPAEAEGPPWSLDLEGVGTIEIADSGGGRWLFTAATVASTPEMVAAVRDREVVEGVTRTGPLTLAQWLRSKVPASLQGRFFLAEAWQWIGLAILILAGIAVNRLVVRLASAFITGYLRKRQEVIDADQMLSSLRPLGLLAATFLWWLGIFWLGLPTQMLQILAVAVRFVMVVSAVWAIYRMVDIAAAVLEVRAERSANKSDDLLVPLFRKTAKILVAAIGLVFIAENLNVNITSLVAGLGIGGLALALAAQDTVRNLFGSLTVILDQPFSVGDWVKIEGVEGTVVELGFRSTRIRTFYDSTITLPNASLISASVDNLGARKFRRWSTFLNVTYETPAESVEALCEGIRELVRLHPHTRKDSYHIYLNKFSESS